MSEFSIEVTDVDVTTEVVEVQTTSLDVADAVPTNVTVSDVGVAGPAGAGGGSTLVTTKTVDGMSYDVQADDHGKLLLTSTIFGIQIWFPENDVTPMPVGTKIDFVQMGAGSITFRDDTNVDIFCTPSNVTRTQYSAATAVKITTNEWVIVGDLQTV